tara:strand:+ start:12430 stop:12606 length:177 start_codon:yes stop_codon:yes gene_type:complete
MKNSFITVLLIFLSACSTTVAILDTAGSTVIYAGKTAINTVDLITPDIINKDEDEEEE